MFLLVSGRHVGAHLYGHQCGVSLQISINLCRIFLHISWGRKIAVTRILARVFAYLPSFISQILDLIYNLNGFDYYFDLFWMAWHWKPGICECPTHTRGVSVYHKHEVVITIKLPVCLFIIGLPFFCTELWFNFIKLLALKWNLQASFE